jgi:hypothetical protein
MWHWPLVPLAVTAGCGVLESKLFIRVILYAVCILPETPFCTRSGLGRNTCKQVTSSHLLSSASGGSCCNCIALLWPHQHCVVGSNYIHKTLERELYYLFVCLNFGRRNSLRSRIEFVNFLQTRALFGCVTPFRQVAWFRYCAICGRVSMVEVPWLLWNYSEFPRVEVFYSNFNNNNWVVWVSIFIRGIPYVVWTWIRLLVLFSSLFDWGRVFE